MAKGVKTFTSPEIGDLVTAKASAIIYTDSTYSTIKETVPNGTNLGMIIDIQPTELGVDIYVIDKGAVLADAVTTKVNPDYVYGNLPASTGTGTTDTDKTTQDTSKGGFWDAFSKILDLGVGILTPKKKTSTATDTDTETDADAAAAKKTVPTWVWIVTGLVVVGGLTAAIFWPKKKAQPTPQQPIIVKNP
jgi:hypothetical protein